MILSELIFVCGEGSAKHGLDAKNFKVGRGDTAISEFHGHIGVSERNAAPGLGGHAGEDSILILPIEKIERGDAVAFAAGRLFPDIENLVRSGKWQGLEENGIDKTENGRGAADAQRQGQNRRCGESGAFADHSQPEAHILAQLVHGPHLDWTACGPAG